MTVSHDIPKVRKSLSGAAFTLERTAESWANIPEMVGLPEALYVVGRALPILPIVLKSLASSMEDSEETMELDQYTAIYQFAELCHQQAKYFNAIFEAITTTDIFNNKEEKYRITAEKCGGLGIEVVMKDLLQRATSLAAALVTDDDLRSSLQAACDEVDKLKPSLKESPRGKVSIKNYGEGNQFYHGGEGNQNHCSGGVQNTGNGYTIHMASP